MDEMKDWLKERGVPSGYEPVWPSDPTSTHALCGCPRHKLVLKDADSHSCVWLYLREIKKETHNG